MESRARENVMKGMALLVLVIMGMMLFRVADTWHVSLLLLSVGMVTVVRPLPLSQWTLTDKALTTLTLFNMVSCLYGTCPTPAVRRAVFSVGCLAVYLVLRRLFAKPRVRRFFQDGSILPVTAALLLAVCSFFIFRRSVLEVGFDDTYSFRSLFRPLGYITNSWAEVLLIVLGWFCLLRRRGTPLLVFLAALAVLLSFSRGAYIAFALFVVAMALTVRPLKRMAALLLPMLAAMALVFACFTAEVRTTLAMNRTVSQQQSTAWRVKTAGTIVPVVRERLLLGWGNGSYTYAIDRAVNQDSTQSFTTLAPNLPALVLVEKGIIGLLLCVMTGIAVCAALWKRRRSADACIVGCTLLALLVREMTQATLLNTTFTCLMLYVLLAFLQRSGQARGGEGGRWLPVMLFAVLIGGNCYNARLWHSERLCRESASELKMGNVEKAVVLIEKTARQVPFLVQRGMNYMECYRKTNDRNYLDEAAMVLEEAHRRQPEDMYIVYLQARLLSWQGAGREAESILQHLVECFPRQALYAYALGELLYRDGRKEAAVTHWADAIFCVPRLMDNPIIKDLQGSDILTFDALQERLTEMSSEVYTPTDCARYGYILFKQDRQEAARKYLEEAVTALPNLTTPWRLLGDDDKFLLLRMGAFSRNRSMERLPQQAVMTEDRLLHDSYGNVFFEWYGCGLVD